MSRANDNPCFSEVVNSAEPIACVVQGGGMRGTYSISALSKLEKLGLTDRFSAIYGSSAGALNGVYFLASQATDGVSIYVDYLSGKRFINFKRIKPIIDIDYLIDVVLTREVPLRQERVLESETDLFVFITDAEDATQKRVHVQNTTFQLMEVLRATAALPIVFGREVDIDRKKYVDGGMVSQVPIQEAINDGWKNILVILTRPLSYRAAKVGSWEKLLMKSLAFVSGHSHGVVRLLGTNIESFNDSMEIVSNENRTSGCNVWIICPSQEANMASRLTTERDVLLQTASLAALDTDRLFKIS
jgi:predicted patatin/cPLA2 family phospholipase